MGVAGFYAFPQKCNIFFIVSRKVGEADQISLIICAIGESHIVWRIGEIGVVAKQAGDGEQMVTLFIAFALGFPFISEKFEADPVLPRQRSCIDIFQPG